MFFLRKIDRRSWWILIRRIRNAFQVIELCPCQTCSMTAEHLLQACVLAGGDYGGEEAFRQSGGPTAHSSLRAGEPECPLECSTRRRRRIFLCCLVWFWTQSPVTIGRRGETFMSMTGVSSTKCARTETTYIWQ